MVHVIYVETMTVYYSIKNYYRPNTREKYSYVQLICFYFKVIILIKIVNIVNSIVYVVL